MKCPRCKTRISSKAKFCSECGLRIEGKTSHSPAPIKAKSSQNHISSKLENHIDNIASERNEQLENVQERYEILELLSSGGMGEVYKARDKRLDRIVALKRIKPALGQDKINIERFITEAKSLASIAHFNIVQVYDAGSDPQGYYLVMEYIQGISLEDYVKKRGKLPIRQALTFTRQVLEALSIAHQNGIIHRDIKPSNILLTKDGQPKLVDFGLAKKVENEGLTSTGVVMGTTHYMSPEQWTDASKADQRSDIYSLGTTLYQMVTGKNPRTIKSENIPKSVRRLILKAVEENPDDRYQSAREMMKDIDLAESGIRVMRKTATTKIVCPQCSKENSREDSYCVNCGHSLLLHCFRCNKENRFNAQHCGGCGLNLREYQEKKWKHLDKIILRAEEEAHNYNFDKAIEILKEIETEDHPVFAEAKIKASEMAFRYNNAKKAIAKEINKHLNEGNRLMQLGDYDTAFKMLANLPEHLKSREIIVLIQQAREKRAEIQKQIDLLRRAIKERDLEKAEKIAADIEQRKPDNDEVKTLRSNIRSNLREQQVVAGNAAYKDGRYEDALKHYQNALDYTPGDADLIKAVNVTQFKLLKHIMNVELAKNHFKKVDQLYDEAVKLASADENLRNSLSDMHLKIHARRKNVFELRLGMYFGIGILATVFLVVLFAVGRVRAKKGEEPLAQAAYKKATEALADNKYFEAKNLFDEIVSKYPDSSVYQKAIEGNRSITDKFETALSDAKNNIIAGEYENARDDLEQARLILPNQSPLADYYILNTGLLAYADQRYEDAKKSFSNLADNANADYFSASVAGQKLQEMETTLTSNLAAAKTLYDQNQFSEAYQKVNIVLAIDSTNEEALALKKKLATITTWQELVKKADQALEEGNYLEAKQTYTSVVDAADSATYVTYAKEGLARLEKIGKQCLDESLDLITDENLTEAQTLLLQAEEILGTTPLISQIKTFLAAAAALKRDNLIEATNKLGILTSPADNPVLKTQLEQLKKDVTASIAAAKRKAKMLLDGRKYAEALENLKVLQTLTPDDRDIIPSLQRANRFAPVSAALVQYGYYQTEELPSDTTELAFSDENLIVSGSNSGTITISELATVKEVIPAAHNGRVTALVISPSGAFFVSGGADGTMKIWLTTEAKTPTVLTEGENQIAALAISPNEKYLASASIDGVVKVWDITSTKLLNTQNAPVADGVISLAFSPDNKLCAIARGQTIFIWDKDLSKLETTLQNPDASITGMIFSKVSTALLSISSDQTLKLWKISNASVVQSVALTAIPTSAALAPNGKAVAVGQVDGSIEFFAISSFNLLATVKNHSAKVNNIFFTPDSQWICSMDAEDNLIIWDAAALKVY